MRRLAKETLGGLACRPPPCRHPPLPARLMLARLLKVRGKGRGRCGGGGVGHVAAVGGGTATAAGTLARARSCNPLAQLIERRARGGGGGLEPTCVTTAR